MVRTMSAEGYCSQCSFPHAASECPRCGCERTDPHPPNEMERYAFDKAELSKERKTLKRQTFDEYMREKHPRMYPPRA